LAHFFRKKIDWLIENARRNKKERESEERIFSYRGRIRGGFTSTSNARN
jgi:hypothetical protein